MAYNKPPSSGSRGSSGSRTTDTPSRFSRNGDERTDRFSHKPRFADKDFSGRKAGGSDDRPAPRVERPQNRDKPFPGERVAKIIARSGLGSRREIEDWIMEGRICVNGEVIDSPALNVTIKDKITVDDRPLPPPERTRLWLYHKPKAIMTTERDPEGRPTVFENLPRSMPRVVSVGRLDFNTEGLLLLTNDGGLKRVLELPATGWMRRYRVRAFGEITPDRLDALKDGITIDGIEYGPVEARIDRQTGNNTWLTVGIREGKNREVKNILGHLGLDVNRLIRLSYGPFQLGDLDEGQVEEISLRILKDQLGERLIEESGADFEGTVRDPLGEMEGQRAPRHEGARTEGHKKPFRPERSERNSRFEQGSSRFENDQTRPERKPRFERNESSEPSFRGERPARDGARRFDRPEGRQDQGRNERPRDEGRSFGSGRFQRDETAGHSDDRRATRKAEAYARLQSGEVASVDEASGKIGMKGSTVQDRKGRDIRVQKRLSGDEGLRTPRREQGREERSGGGGDRPFRPRPPRDGQKERPRSFNRDERSGGGGDRPFRPRPPRDGQEERPRSFNRDERSGGGDRPFRPRPPRDEPPRGGGRGFGPKKPRFED